MVAQTAQGYGFIDTIPALYGLWWLDSELIEAYLKSAIGGPKVPTIITGGFSSLWQNMYYQDKLEVEFNVQITEIRRNTEPHLPKIQITYKQANQIHHKEYDWLFVAAPLPDIVPLFTNPQKFELEVAKALHPVTIITHLIDAGDENDYSKDDEAILSWPDSLISSGQGNLCTVRNTAKAIMDRTDIAMPLGRYSYVTYQLYDRMINQEEAEKSTLIMKKNLTDYGFTKIDVIESRPRTYFYHFDLEGLHVKHYPWKILEYQGNLSTIFIGASVSFESMNDVVNYNFMLTEQYFQFEP